MFDSTSMLIYTLFYIIVSACFVLRTTEFVSNGLTVEDLFDFIIEKEYNNFVMHHIKRTSISIVVHSSVPLIYLLGTVFVDDSENSFVHAYYLELFILALIPIIFSCSLLVKWKRNNWADHPLSLILSRYDPSDWTTVAHDISTEYQRIDKLTLACGSLTRTVVTQNWVISIKPYTVSIAKKSESSFLAYSSDDHDATPDGTVGGVQFINIQVIPIRSRIKWFFIRIRSEDFKLLEDNIGQPIRISDNVKVHRSRTERFVEVFRDQVTQNPVYNGYTKAELEDVTCVGCLVNPPDVKLIKCCEDNMNTDVNKCTSCQCKPMWCVDCMAKWYESRQSQNDTTIWLSSKCTCPLCRRVFCILDVCPLEHSDLAKAK